MKIDPKERQRAVEQARPEYIADMSDRVQEFSRSELGDIRNSLRLVQMSGSSVEELRARRLLAMVDAYEAAEHYQVAVQEALNEADTEQLVDRLDAMKSSVTVEFDALAPANLDDILAENPNASAEAIVELCKAFYEKKLTELRRVTEQEFDEYAGLVKGAHDALEKIDPTKKAKP